MNFILNELLKFHNFLIKFSQIVYDLKVIICHYFLCINIFTQNIFENFKINKKITYSCRYKSLTYVTKFLFYKNK